MKAATAPPLSSSCAAATSGGRGVCGGAGAVEAATRRWEDSARRGVGGSVIPAHRGAGRGAGSAAPGPRAPGSTTRSSAARAPSGASQASWAPAWPAAAFSFPSPAGPAAVAGSGAARSAQVPSAGGSRAGDPAAARPLLLLLSRRAGRASSRTPQGAVVAQARAASASAQRPAFSTEGFALARPPPCHPK